MPELATDAEVNVRGPKDVALLTLDGVPFPHSIDRQHGIKIEVNDNDVHLVIVAIQVDHAVTDHSSPSAHKPDA